MANQEQQTRKQPEQAGAQGWSQVLGNGLWVVTLLMVLAFFWQSIGMMLAE